MATFGAAKSLQTVVRGATTGVRGGVALLGFGLGLGLVLAPVWWVRDIMVRDISGVPVVMALNGSGATGGDATPAALPRRAEPDLPRPVEAVVRADDAAIEDAGATSEPPERGAVSRSPVPRPRPERRQSGEDWTLLRGAGGQGIG